MARSLNVFVEQTLLLMVMLKVVVVVRYKCRCVCLYLCGFKQKFDSLHVLKTTCSEREMSAAEGHVELTCSGCTVVSWSSLHFRHRTMNHTLIFLHARVVHLLEFISMLRSAFRSV